ncbi:alpha/beta hydrolase [Kitasatospora sp. NPDC088346]|uniref:alpha/beta hydrolase n=1 Tax=Kitasatospora sp. NPDC088346 TaxID=3364073 RepID=UPI00382FA749
MSEFYRLLVAFDPDAVRAAATAWRGLAHAVEDAGDRHRTTVDGPLRHSWQGRDAEAAFLSMERTEQELDIVRVEAEAAALALDTVADRMRQAQTNLLNAVHRAGEWGLPVSAVGTVGLPPVDPAERHDPDAAAPRRELARRAGEFQERIDAALRAAREASDQGRSALAQLDGDILTRPRAFGASAETATDTAAVLGGLGLVDPSVPDGSDPGRSAAWWRSLSPDQQRSQLALHPEEIGRLDGLPAAVRDRANRLVLDRRLDALRQGNPADFGITDEAYNERQAALTAIRRRLDENDGEDEAHRLLLLGIDPEGDGRAIVSTGNPDDARHIAVFVPGTNTVLAGVPGQIDHIKGLQSAAEGSAGPGEKVAVISWLGYDTPEWGNGSVATSARGDQAAEPMRRFTEGVRAARPDGSPGHLTVIGHSYGSYAVGAAARGGGGLGADEIISLASPGMGVDSAAQLGIDPGHVWVGTARDDGIQAVAGTVLGAEPQSREFGAHRLAIDTSGHSGYWKPGSESLAGQGRIIAGREPKLVPEIPR